MSNCIFCLISQGQIPTNKVYEDDVVMAFLDMGQVTKGHTLVVPKTHVDDIYGYDDELAGQVFSRIPKIVRAMEKAFPDMKGVNIINNNREIAFQSVFHSHIHIIPRYTDDDGFGLKWQTSPEGTYSDSDLLAIAQSINDSIEEEEA